MEILEHRQEPKKTLWGLILDNFWLGVFLCLLTLFGYLMWAVIEIQNHYYFITTPFAPSGLQIP